MRYTIFLLFIVNIQFAQKNNLENERIFRTKIGHRWHKILNNKYTLDPKNDFILLCFEKINNKAMSSAKDIDIKSKQNIFGVNVSDTLCKLKMYSQARGNANRLDDRKSLVLTHWLSNFESDQKINYNIYSKEIKKEDYNIYIDGKSELDNLKKILQERLKKKKYTHIILMSTGWNTNQRRSVERYNEWSCSLDKMRKDSSFKPLYIGLTWPSNWFTKVMIDNISKNRDADELGLLNVNYLIWKVIMPVCEEEKTSFVILGHSFGAKILTRASHSSIYFTSPYTLTKQIDLMFNFQGAYRIIRHSKTDWPRNTINGGLYNLSTPWKKFIITSSKHDVPLKLARLFGVYTGNCKALKFENTNDYFETNFVDTEGNICNIKKNKPYVILDCRNVIWTHNDVSHPRIGRLIWTYMK